MNLKRSSANFFSIGGCCSFNHIEPQILIDQFKINIDCNDKKIHKISLKNTKRSDRSSDLGFQKKNQKEQQISPQLLKLDLQSKVANQKGRISTHSSPKNAFQLRQQNITKSIGIEKPRLEPLTFKQNYVNHGNNQPKNDFSDQKTKRIMTNYRPKIIINFNNTAPLYQPDLQKTKSRKSINSINSINSVHQKIYENCVKTRQISNLSQLKNSVVSYNIQSDTQRNEEESIVIVDYFNPDKQKQRELIEILTYREIS